MLIQLLIYSTNELRSVFVVSAEAVQTESGRDWRIPHISITYPKGMECSKRCVPGLTHLLKIGEEFVEMSVAKGPLSILQMSVDENCATFCVLTTPQG